jgi:hypothetical protein
VCEHVVDLRRPVPQLCFKRGFGFWFEALWRRPLAGVALTAAGLPLLIYFILTFCRLPPPVTPRTFRHLLLFAIAWDSAGTVMLTVLSLTAWAQRGSLDTVVKVALPISVAACVTVGLVLLTYHSRFKQEEGYAPAARHPRDGA